MTEMIEEIKLSPEQSEKVSESLQKRLESVDPFKYRTIQRLAQWLSVAAGAVGVTPLEIALYKFGLLDLDTQVLSVTDHHSKIEKTLTNFNHLFEEGKSLMTKGTSQPIDPSDAIPPHLKFLLKKGASQLIYLADAISIPISSSLDLLGANLALQRLAEKIIADNLPSKPSELTEMQRLRITQTKFLVPLALSKMTNGDISTEEALLLTACLGLQKNDKVYNVCNLVTGNLIEDCNSMLTSNNYKLIFRDPNVLLKSIPSKSDKDIENTIELLEIQDRFIEKLSKEEKLVEEKFVKVLNEAVDPKQVRMIFDKFETYFPKDQRELALKYKSEFFQTIQSAFKDVEKKKDLPNQKTFENDLKNIEARARLIKASKQEESLRKKFNTYDKEILSYLSQLSDLSLKQESPSCIYIRWIVQGIEIIEKMDITKTCAITRRVICPDTTSDRIDLVYFSNTNEESVVSHWNALCQKKKSFRL